MFYWNLIVCALKPYAGMTSSWINAGILVYLIWCFKVSILLQRNFDIKELKIIYKWSIKEKLCKKKLQCVVCLHSKFYEILPSLRNTPHLNNERNEPKARKQDVNFSVNLFERKQKKYWKVLRHKFPYCQTHNIQFNHSNSDACAESAGRRVCVWKHCDLIAVARDNPARFLLIPFRCYGMRWNNSLILKVFNAYIYILDIHEWI